MNSTIDASGRAAKLTWFAAGMCAVALVLHSVTLALLNNAHASDQRILNSSGWPFAYQHVYADVGPGSIALIAAVFIDGAAIGILCTFMCCCCKVTNPAPALALAASVEL